MSWAVVAAASKELYAKKKEIDAEMAETDKVVAELFSQDMTPARQLPIMSIYWMYFEGDFWYVTHDDLSLSEIASTYLPVDRNVENSWNKRWTELWDYQPEEFKFMAINHGTQYNPIKVKKLTNGQLAYWGPLPNGTPVRMPQESVDIALLNGVEIPNYDEANMISDGFGGYIIAIPTIVADKQDLANMKMGNLIKSKEDSNSNFWWWALGITATLAVVGGGGYYVWSKYK